MNTTTPSNLSALTQTLAQSPAVRQAAVVGAAALWRRLQRPSSRLLPADRSMLFLATGLLVGAAAGLFLAPTSGRELRQLAGKRIGGGLGKLLGEQAGAHPIDTAKAVRAVQGFSSAK